MNSPLAALFTNPLLAIAYLFAIVIAITIHEFAHAWTADRLGDDTPRLMGRVTLSPAAHLDPIGSLLFLLIGFGYGKPVVYNPLRLSRRVDELLIALAGPLSNILLAMLLFAARGVVTTFGLEAVFQLELLQLMAEINIVLAAFNMLPVPPLDGSSIIAYFWPEYRSLVGSQLGLMALLILIFTGVLSQLVVPLIHIFTVLATLGGILR
jgi:Zn-dependent protease